IVGDAGASVVLSTDVVRTSVAHYLADAPALRALDWLATDAPGALDVHPFCDEAATPDRIAFLQYTSGSTSAPKGVMISHDNLFQNARQITDGFSLEMDGRCVFWLPLYHDMGLIGGVLQPIQICEPCYLMPP